LCGLARIRGRPRRDEKKTNAQRMDSIDGRGTLVIEALRVDLTDFG
jgi:hypothetical protein